MNTVFVFNAGRRQRARSLNCPARQKLMLLCRMMGRAPTLCGASLACVGYIMDSIATQIENAWDGLEIQTDPVRHAENTDDQAKFRKRKYSLDLRRAMRSRVADSRVSMKTLDNIGTKVGITGASHWMARDTPGYLHACKRVFITENDDDVVVLGVCLDGARLGKPLEETIMYGITDGRTCAVGTPMVNIGGYVWKPIQPY